MKEFTTIDSNDAQPDLIWTERDVVDIVSSEKLDEYGPVSAALPSALAAPSPSAKHAAALLRRGCAGREREQ